MTTVSRNLWLAALLLAATTAVAQGNGNGRNRDNRAQAQQSEQISITFSTDQREYVRSYAGERAGRACPPGLAKKNNGCLPPGQAAKRYRVGESLTAGIVIGSVPAELTVRIGLPPPGYAYGVIDGDLVKLVVGSLLVVDAIEGLGL